MTTIAHIHLDCPCCGRQFESETVMSTNRAGMRTDFQPITMGCSYIELIVHGCPHCHFCGMHQDFKQPRLSADVRDAIMKELVPHASDALDAARRYELAALIGPLTGKNHEQTGGLYLAAAWCCRDRQLLERERDYRTKAITCYKRWLQEKTASNQLMTTYIVGELYRRLEQHEEAGQWFDRVMALCESDHRDNDNCDFWRELARQQKEAPRD